MSSVPVPAAAVVVDHMSFRYFESESGVTDVDFSLKAGDRVLLIGQNGCGKSTLLSLIGGRHKAAGGAITVLGSDAFEDTTLNDRVTLIGHPWPPEAYFANTVECVASPAPFPARRAAIARDLHLGMNAMVDKMSSGEKRRVQILHGMLRQPSVILLDECSTDIDVAERRTVLELVRRECTTDRCVVSGSGPFEGRPVPQRQQPACCIYATHILDGVEGWATHVALMSGGRIVDFRPVGDVESLVQAAAAASPTEYQPALIEQYAHTFVSKNKSRERLYRSYMQPAVADAGANPIAAARAATPPTYFYAEAINAASPAQEAEKPRSPFYSEENIIECVNVNVPKVFSDLNLTIRRGSRTLLLGCNGTGKSTLLNTWGGKRLFVSGVPVPVAAATDKTTESSATTMVDAAKSRNVALINGHRMYDDMRQMIQTVVYGGDWWTKPPSGEMRVWDLIPQPCTARAHTIAELLNIDWSWDVRHTSSGEQKRVQLLLHLQHDRPVVLLDEATADLDVDQRHTLLRFLFLENATKGTTIVYTTHIFEGLVGWASDVIILDRTAGRVHSAQRFETFAEAENPRLFEEITETLVQLKMKETF